MKKHLFKFALTLFVCMLSNVALADENPYCFPFQDFSDFTIEPDWTKGSKKVNGWEVYYCDSKSFGNISDNFALLINCSNNTNPNNVGYAITPEIEYSGDVILSLKYGNSSAKNANMKITIIGRGFFEDGSTSKEVLVTRKFVDDKGPLSDDICIIGVTSDTRIKFHFKTPQNNTYYYYYIDDVSVTKDGMTLDETIDNAPWITGNKNEIITVKTVRTLKANIWNTLCLPFNVDMNVLEGAFGANKGIQLRVFDEYDDATYTMKFKTPENNSIAAGTPFLIKVNEDIVNPTFTGVTISDVSAQPNGNNGVSFVGTYSRKELAIDGTNLFITTDNELAKPTATGNKMPGLRAYITVPSNFDFNDARLFLDDEATAINNIGTQKATNSVTLFNLQGQRVEHPRSGLYIKNNKLTIIR